VSGFSADWLSLREAADARARDPSLLRRAADLAATRHGRLVDLGTGTGGLPRDLSTRLPRPRDWLLVDDTPALLAEAARQCAGRPGFADVRVRQADLARDVALLGEEPFALATASALLDLVSAQWIARLVAACAAARLPFYASLSYDGRIALAPEAEGDTALVAAMNRHQVGDKGFGPALGPAAAGAAAVAFREAGFDVDEAEADWQLDRADAALVLPLVDGWIGAAAELEPGDAPRLAAWRALRVAQLRAGTLRVRVGHRDLLAIPPR
jgi:SAM-dependent methyltransferase